jgi:hypothetical protein
MIHDGQRGLFLVMLTVVFVSQTRGQGEVFLDSGLELVDAGDISRMTGTVTHRWEDGIWQWETGLTYDRFSIGYQPNALSAGISRPRELDEERKSVSTALTRTFGDRLEGTVGANLAEGFSDYRSVWISEYYRQLFSGFDAYRDPDPRSFGGSLALLWEAVPQNVFLDLTLNAGQERIAPGYERIIGPGGGLEKDEELLNAWSATIGLEHLPSPRHRLRHELRATTVSGRDIRLSYRARLNWAIADEWVQQSDFSYLVEGSEFYAWSAGASLERDWDERWFLGLGVRAYTDNGQLENALFTVTSAAPPLEAFRLTARLRYAGERIAILLYAGPYFSRYDNPGDDIAPFANLYRDRDWFHGGLRFSLAF